MNDNENTVIISTEQEQEQRQVELALKMNRLLTLTPEQRQYAKMQASKVITDSATDKPNRSDFVSMNESEYPNWFRNTIMGLIILIWVSAGILSFFRVHEAGRVYFLGTYAQTSETVTSAINTESFTGGINNPSQASTAGFLVFVMAEIMMLVAMIAMSTIMKDKKWVRFALWIPVAIGAGIALFGNIVIEQPHDIFGWLITIAPPLTVIVFAEVASGFILEAITTRKANHSEFTVAMRIWDSANKKPEAHPDFKKHYRTYLKLEIQKVNQLGAGAKERKMIMESLTGNDWRYVIKRELEFDNNDNFDDVSLTAQMMSGGIQTHRLVSNNTPQPVNVLNSSSFVQILSNNGQDNLDNSDNSGRNMDSGQRKQYGKSQTVIEHFKNNPNDLNRSSRELESIIGIGKSTINTVQNAIRNGEIIL